MLSRNTRRSIRLLAGILVCASTIGQAATEANDYLDMELEELLDIPLDFNTVNIQESHIHKKDEWMIGYRYMNMAMKGNRSGNDPINTQAVLQHFMVAPTAMRMEMHMGSLMYAPTNDLTLMAMLPYRKLGMDHVTRMGMKFSSSAEGLGDLKIMANAVVFRMPWDKHLISIKGGISLPSGSIDQRGDTPAGKNQRLPYPMQLGSGTYDFLPGITYTGLSRDWGWGAQISGTVRSGRNAHHYRLGDELESAVWLTHAWDSWVSTTLRLNSQWWGDIHGADLQLNPIMVPTANPTLRAGHRIDLALGIEFYADDGALQGQHLGIEVGMPVHQSLNGPQLELDWQISAGWQWTF